ncbi:apolipoprotein N-acyltransferase [soil metagenome]
MIYVLAILGAGLAVLAFPPFGIWPLVVAGPAVWLAGLLGADRPWKGALSGLSFGLVFYGGLIWWLSELGWEAVVPLVIVQALFPAVYGWAFAKWMRPGGSAVRWVVAAGIWGLLEALRYRFPLGGFEWGAWGYALSDLAGARAAARWIGVSGWTVLVMGAAAGLASLRRPAEWRTAALPALGVAVVVFGMGAAAPPLPSGTPLEVAVVQGSTPCPFERCPDERFLTYHQHLALTRTIPPGRVGLVVWSEGSTGSLNADPVNNPEVGEAIGTQAERIGAWMVVGGDRPVSETHWVNANVLFSPAGEIVDEYRKQQPVPFGEYVPQREFFTRLVPSLWRVPRDMIPGDGPVVFDPPHFRLGTVISFEGLFPRFARENAAEGAGLLVVATNQGSYAYTPASDQFIGITRMRSAETGLDLIHSAVTGRSVVITDGGVLGEATGLGTVELLYGSVETRPGLRTLYVRLGDWVVAVAALAAVVALLARPHPRCYPRA